MAKPERQIPKERPRLKAGVARPHTALRRILRQMPKGVRDVLDVLEAKGAPGFLVGGAVRDAFLGPHHQADWDLASRAPPKDVASWFKRVVRTGEKHGTIMILTPDGPVEVTTFRGEGEYLDGRRPSSVNFLQSIEGDLARRDFTINAMALDFQNGVILDPFSGQDDLRAELVRTVGDAHTRFSEDGLRPLRALRFASRLDFRLNADTQKALGTTLSTFDQVAGERKRAELERLLVGPQAVYGLSLMHQSGMLEHWLSPLFIPEQIDLLSKVPADPWLRFAAWLLLAELSPPVIDEILSKLFVSRKIQDRIISLVKASLSLRDLKKRPPAAQLREWISTFGKSIAMDAAFLVEMLEGGGAFVGSHRAVKRALQNGFPMGIGDLAIGGAELQDLGLKGPEVGVTLRHLHRWVLERPARNKKRALLAYTHTLSTGKKPSVN